ncbi:MAG: MBOAT family O-acyltransferase [Isosphaeraceae bacterium]
MSPVGWLLAAVAVAYGCAALAPILRLRAPGVVAIWAVWCLVPLILACPLLIPAGNVGLRAVSATVSGDLAFKIVDYFRRWDRFDRSDRLRNYHRLLIPFPVFAVIHPDHRRRFPRQRPVWPDVLRLGLGVVGFVAAILTLNTLTSGARMRSNFTLNHLATLITFIVAIESVSRAFHGLERLAGFDTTPIIRNAYRSRTVSEFWRRYNARIHDWLYRNVFLTTGGRHAPARSVVMVFLVSGALHELMFGIATSRFTGYQFAFFALQAPAALASGRLERLARQGGITGQIVAHGSTILFMAVTSVLFFDGVRRVFPFIHASESPLPW